MKQELNLFYVRVFFVAAFCRINGVCCGSEREILMMLLITNKSVIVLLFRTTIGHTIFKAKNKEALFKHEPPGIVVLFSFILMFCRGTL